SAVRGLVMVVVGAVAGVLPARLAAAPHTPAALTPIAVWPHGWVELLQTSLTIVAHPVSLIVLGVVAVCVTVLLLYRIDRDPVVLSCIAVGVAVTHWLVVGASEWVRMNLYYPRYIFPSLMMLGIAAVTPIVFLAGRVSLGDRRPRFLIGASAIALLVTSMSVYGMPSWRR